MTLNLKLEEHLSRLKTILWLKGEEGKVVMNEDLG
jgi:hypothetical protein